MTPAQYEQARRKLTRFGESFDMSLTSKLPPPVVRTKAGKIAKRQPQYDKRPRTYYQAQCSFRGLTSGSLTQELQEALQSRDVGQDQVIHHELVRLGREADIYEAEQEGIRFEEWWKSSSTPFEEKLLRLPQRALQEERDKPDSCLRVSCLTFPGHRFDILRASKKVGLACEEVQGPTDLPPGSVVEQCQIVGEATAVRMEAETFKRAAEQKAQEQWGYRRAQVEANEAAELVQRESLIREAMYLDDWDLTGKWNVQCDALAEQYDEETPEKLHMEIFKDDYRLDAAGDDEETSEDEGSENEDERDADGEPVQECPADLIRPRFCARFDFGRLEGMMRIYPQTSAQCPNWRSISENPTFKLRWRGRDTGEGEIMGEALEHVRSMTFSEVGTKVEGTLYCPSMGGSFPFTGTKVAHGRGQKLSSSYEWNGLNEAAWARESCL